jgi:IS30 family transposase
MRKQGFSLRLIAKTMGRSVSTVSRELKRNTGKRNYRPKQAHEFAQQRHQKKNKETKLTSNLLRSGYLVFLAPDMSKETSFSVTHTLPLPFNWFSCVAINSNFTHYRGWSLTICP